jgi:hypothetical protein
MLCSCASPPRQRPSGSTRLETTCFDDAGHPVCHARPRLAQTGANGRAGFAPCASKRRHLRRRLQRKPLSAGTTTACAMRNPQALSALWSKPSANFKSFSSVKRGLLMNTLLVRE